MDLFGPVGRGGASLESVLEAAVESFNGTVCLRMIGGGLVMPNIEHSAKIKPHI